MTRRYAATLAAVLIVPSTLACAVGETIVGCGGHGTEDITMADVTGTWSGADAGTIKLNADGSFAATDLREKDGDKTRLVSGQGTWSLNQTSSKETERTPGVSDVQLTFVQPDGTARVWNKIDVAQVRPVSRLEYVYSLAESAWDDCDLRELTRATDLTKTARESGRAWPTAGR